MLDSPAKITGASDPGSNLLEAPYAAARDSLSGFLSAVRQRRLTLLAVIVLLPLCNWIVLQQMTPLYTATGALIYEPSEYTLREMQSILRSETTNDAMMASQAEILHSLNIAQRVAERGNLFDNPQFNAALRPPGLLHRMIRAAQGLLGMDTDAPPADRVYGPEQDPTRDRTMLAVQEALKAVPVRLSHVVEVTFTAADPYVAAAAVNNAMDAYIKEQYAAKHRAVDSANALLEKQASVDFHNRGNSRNSAIAPRAGTSVGLSNESERMAEPELRISRYGNTVRLHALRKKCMPSSGIRPKWKWMRG